MTKLTNEQKFYRLLRERNGLTLDEIYEGLNKEISKTEILNYIVGARVDNYIYIKEGPTTKEDKFFLRFIFNPVRRVLTDGYYNYDDLKKTKTQMIGSDEVEITPKRGEHIVERSQGNTPTCFRPTVKVLMEDFSYKPIGKVRIGEYVISHLGNSRRIVEKQQREWQGRSLIFSIYNSLDKIECSLEHPFLTLNGWKKASDITTDDYIAIPRLNNIVKHSQIYEREKDPDYLWLLGMYLAEGSSRGEKDGHRVGEITFSLNIEEESICDKLIKIMSRYGYSKHSVSKNGEHHTIQLSFYGKNLDNLFEESCGRYCHLKKLHPRFMFIEPILQKNILIGWMDGDGYFDVVRNRMVGVSTSNELIRQMYHISIRCGIRPNVTKRWKQEGKKDCWDLTFQKNPNENNNYRGYIDGNFIWGKVRNIEKVPQYLGGNLYNLEIEDDNSYIVEGVAVHNCVGNASAALMDDIHSALCPEDNPTSEDKAELKRNVLYDSNNPGGAYYDILYWQSFSAGGIYYYFRKLDNFTQAGYYIDSALKHLVTDGAGRDRQWILFKDGVYAAKDPLPDVDPETGEKYFDTAAKHKIDGFARCSSNLSMINALLDHDNIGLLAAMEIAEVTFNNAKGNGIWQSWKGASLGGHAVLIKGRSKRGNTWGWDFYNSWVTEGYPRLEWMSDSYWQRARIDCFVALDSEEASFIRENIRQKVTFITNAPAQFYIDGVYHGDTTDNKLSAQLQKEKEYCIIAKKKSNLLNTVSKKVKVTPDVVEVQFFFKEDPITPPPQKPNVGEIIKKLLERLKNIFGKK